MNDLNLETVQNNSLVASRYMPQFFKMTQDSATQRLAMITESDIVRRIKTNTEDPYDLGTSMKDEEWWKIPLLLKGRTSQSHFIGCSISGLVDYKMATEILEEQSPGTVFAQNAKEYLKVEEGVFTALGIAACLTPFLREKSSLSDTDMKEIYLKLEQNPYNKIQLPEQFPKALNKQLELFETQLSSFVTHQAEYENLMARYKDYNNRSIKVPDFKELLRLFQTKNPKCFIEIVNAITTFALHYSTKICQDGIIEMQALKSKL